MQARSFIKNERGVSSIFFAFFFPIMLVIGGSAIDYARAYALRAEIQRGAEAAALAAASLTSVRTADEVIREYVELNSATIVQDLEYDITFVEQSTAFSKNIEVTVDARVETYFLQLIGIEELQVSASAEAAEARQNIEISVVLDISSSMRGQKLSELKVAAADFVETMLGRASDKEVSISIVPFGGTVNMGDTLFARFVLESDDATVDPALADYNIGGGVLDAAFLFTNGETCIETPYTQFTTDAIPASNGSPQIPDLWVWNNGNPWCPPDASGLFLNSATLATLTTHIDGMVLSDGTGMDIGALWGYRALSPRWRGLLGGEFPDRPGPFDENTIKVMIVMTDGEITAQFRPRDPEIIRARGGNRQTVAPRGNSGAAPGADSAVGNFKQVCENAKNDGVIVYTIGFQINAGSLADQLLADCASGPGRYYFVEGLDIGAAFEAIAASITALRITG